MHINPIALYLSSRVQIWHRLGCTVLVWLCSLRSAAFSTHKTSAGPVLAAFLGMCLMFLALKTILDSPQHVKHQGHGVTDQCLSVFLLITACLHQVFSGTSDQAFTVHFPLG